jgi:hypothetical protein
VNVLLLAIAFRAWTGSALSVYLRIMAAIATFSLEMQVSTWAHSGTLESLRLVNLGLAAIGVLWHARRARTTPADADVAVVPDPRSPSPAARLPPVAALLALGVLIASLALMLPVAGADPYHLHRVDQITGRGTLAYDPAALDIKINALAGVYELLLADLRIPGMATALVRFHGVFGLGLYLLTIAAVAPWIGLRRRWLLMTFLVIPVVFHQFVLVKNDLFGALPVFAALAWVVTRGARMSTGEVLAAAALAGFAVGIKISSAPVVLVVLAFVGWDHRHRPAAVGAAILSAAAGATAGGLVFSLVENAVVYGGPLQPYLALGNRHESLGDSLIGIGRFAVSLFDMGLVTPRLWPGRGGWGSTFGLPMVWSLAVLALSWRLAIVRRALVAVGAVFLALAASYPDADIAHRLVMGAGLVAVLVAIGCADGDDRKAAMMRRVLVVVLVASALQIARSALLYMRG